MPTAIEQLQLLAKELRDKKRGDPWIIAQTFESMAQLTVEESYELLDSIHRQQPKDIQDELGDLLLHIVLYAEMAEENRQFDLNNIAESAIAKQLRRKPAFQDASEHTAEEALKQWEENKQQEKTATTASSNTSILEGITQSLPSLLRAMKLQTRAANVGFDWQNAAQIFEKLDEEILELKQAEQKQDIKNMVEELGDLLFTCVNLARKLNIEPELALKHANDKFEQRFRAMESLLRQQHRQIQDCHFDEMNVLWERVKL